jgi:hypothetical protein
MKPVIMLPLPNSKPRTAAALDDVALVVPDVELALPEVVVFGGVPLADMTLSSI